MSKEYHWLAVDTILSHALKCGIFAIAILICHQLNKIWDLSILKRTVCKLAWILVGFWWPFTVVRCVRHRTENHELNNDGMTFAFVHIEPCSSYIQRLDGCWAVILSVVWVFVFMFRLMLMFCTLRYEWTHLHIFCFHCLRTVLCIDFDYDPTIISIHSIL